MPAFKQGQKVLCIDDSGIDPPYGEAVPVEGRTYTIRNMIGECVRLVEIRNVPNEYREGTMECLFKANRFKRKTGKP